MTDLFAFWFQLNVMSIPEIKSRDLSLKNTIHSCVTNTLQNYASHTNESLLREIHPDVNIRLNSVNVIVGKQSSGKTVIALEEVIKLGVLDTHHLFVYVTKDGHETDKTWLALKPLLQIPYVIVSESDAVDALKTIIAAKNLYGIIRNDNLQDKIDDKQLLDMFDVLAVSNFERETLHTIVLFDDISNSKLFQNEGSYFSQLIRRCRHINVSFFLLIQGWKGLRPHVKNEITTLFIFPCFNRQQLRYIYGQSASNLAFDEFNELYTEILKQKNKNPDAHPYMVVQVSTGGDTKVVCD